LEQHPGEGVKTNVLGTQNVVQAAVEVGTKRLLLISTDKAAEPVSILGATKRLAEMIVQANGNGKMRVCSVRFGNVLGSRGSVLTALSAQVAAGGPVTVTHPDVTRYFMTADEAVQLVLQAAVIGRDGEVLVLDMGEQVRIIDMAKRLVASVPRQVEIVFTGLRPGEKLTEDLLGTGELDDRPYHPLIRHVPVAPLAPAAVRNLDPAGGTVRLRAQLTRCSESSPVNSEALTDTRSQTAEPTLAPAASDA
ncbi:MAG: polysaccharide biosynthesis protein, partial [Streptosporangiaceae bacterium]